MAVEAGHAAGRRAALALLALLGALAPVLAPAVASRAAVWAVPILDPEAARAVVAAGGAVEIALHVREAPADVGLRIALQPRGVDPALAPEWPRARQQALCPLGVAPLAESLRWVRVRIERSDALERVLGSDLPLAPLAPPEIQIGEAWSPIPFDAASWEAPTFSCAFAAGQREARWLYGDWDGDGVRAVGKYVPALDQALLDANANGRWDGVAGGDRWARVAGAAGPGEALVGDWNGDGVEDLGKAVGSAAFLDANGSGRWEGRAGGDALWFVAPGRPDAVYVVGDWDGDGRDQLGRFEAALGRFLLDTNGNGRWDGAAAGDRRVDFGVPALAAPEPFVGDFDGAPGDGAGQASLGSVQADLDEDGVFRGAPGGDLELLLTWPAAGSELPPRPSGVD